MPKTLEQTDDDLSDEPLVVELTPKGKLMRFRVRNMAQDARNDQFIWNDLQPISNFNIAKEHAPKTGKKFDIILAYIGKGRWLMGAFKESIKPEDLEALAWGGLIFDRETRTGQGVKAKIAEGSKEASYVLLDLIAYNLSYTENEFWDDTRKEMLSLIRERRERMLHGEAGQSFSAIDVAVMEITLPAP